MPFYRPTALELREDMTAAAGALAAATAARRSWRRRTRVGYPERVEALTKHLENLCRHGGVLRSHLKSADHNDGPPYGPYVRRSLKKLLKDLRYERAQLRKMLP